MGSIPDESYAKMVAAIPRRQRSEVIADLLAEEIQEREQELHQAAAPGKARPGPAWATVRTGARHREQRDCGAFTFAEWISVSNSEFLGSCGQYD